MYRITNTNYAGFVVTYDIFPSEENETMLKSITDYTRMEALVDEILRSRTFYCEEVIVKPDFFLDKHGTPLLTSKDLAEIRSDLTRREKIIPTPEEAAELIKEAEADPRTNQGFSIAFYDHGIELTLLDDVPQDFFRGIHSSIEHASAISAKVCEYLKSKK